MPVSGATVLSTYSAHFTATSDIGCAGVSVFPLRMQTKNAPDKKSMVHFRPSCSSQQSTATLEVVRLRSSDNAVAINEKLAS